LFAVLQATQFESILEASLYAYTVYGAAITPVVMAVFFWRRTTTAGAMASIAFGTVVTVAWKMTQQWAPAVFPEFLRDVDAVYPALACSLLSLVLVSLITPAPSEDLHRKMETA